VVYIVLAYSFGHLHWLPRVVIIEQQDSTSEGSTAFGFCSSATSTSQPGMRAELPISQVSGNICAWEADGRDSILVDSHWDSLAFPIYMTHISPNTVQS
jgi:hypothetical protein